MSDYEKRIDAILARYGRGQESLAANHSKLEELAREMAQELAKRQTGLRLPN